MSGCFFSFDRANDLEPGDVQGVAVNEAGEVVGFAAVKVEGSSRVTRADAEGRFKIRGLPAGVWVIRLAQDADGDGRPERAVVRAVRLAQVEHEGGLFEDGDVKVSAIDLGPVELSPVASATGTVRLPGGQDLPPGQNARVSVFRRLSTDSVDVGGGQDGAREETLSEEYAVGTGAGGVFEIPALASGDVIFFAEFTDIAGETFVVESDVVRLEAGARVVDINLELVPTPEEPNARLEVTLAPRPQVGELIFLQVVAAGADPVLVDVAGLQRGDPGVFAYEEPLSVPNVPTGRFDIFVTTGLGTGIAKERIVGPGVLLVQLHVEVGDEDCDGDCDNDGLPALCPEGELCPNYTACADQCADAFGDDTRDTVCELDGERFDCEDDVDGQSDVTEPASCVGANLSSDFDGDGVCAVVDTLPQCNQFIDPTCGIEPLPIVTPPPVRPEYTEDPVLDAGPDPIDAGPGDDAGPGEDAGPGNITPEADSFSVVAVAEISLDIALVDRIRDADGDDLTVTLPNATSTNGAALALNGAGASAVITFTSVAAGEDTFTYEVSDSSGASAVGTVTVTVDDAPNAAPVALDDTADTDEDIAVVIDVLTNDTDDVAIDTASLVVVAPATNGQTAVENGEVRYTPNAEFSGSDTFSYTVDDEDGATSNVAIVTVTIAAVNDAPLARDDGATTQEDAEVTINALANDIDVDGTVDVATLVIEGQPSTGSVVIDTGAFVYTQNPGTSGIDTFTYSVADDLGLRSAIAVVTVNVGAVNDPPVATDDAATTDEDVAVTVAVLDNDADVDGTLDPASVTVISPPTQGSAVAQADGTIIYTPNANTFGADSFTYEVRDDGFLGDTATVNITVTSVNDLPVAVADVANTQEDTDVIVDVLANDQDVENSIDPATVVVELAPGAGTAVAQANGTIVYTPNADQSGADVFTYSVADADGGRSTAVNVDVTVAAVNDAPVAVDDAATLDEDNDLLVDVLAK